MTNAKRTRMNVEQGFLIAELAEVAAKLPKRDNIFAGQMIKAYDCFGKLSARQEAVVREILLRAGV